MLKFTVVRPPPTSVTKRFDQFDLGDVLVASSTMLAGIKVGSRSLRFAHGTAKDVPSDAKYIDPANVTIAVEV